MRVLLVVWNFYPNTAYTNRTKATVRGMQETGCQVDVLSIKPLVSVETMCIKGIKTTKGSLLSTLYGMICNQLLLIRSIKNYDVVFCDTDVYYTVRACLRYAKKNNKCIVHERTEFPDFMYKTYKASYKKLKAYLRCVSEFDKIFVISNPIKDYFVENAIPQERISIYPMIVEPQRFENINKKDVGFRYFAYCGNMGNYKDGVADLIEAFGCSKAKDTHKLLLIGAKPQGEEARIYQMIIEKYNLRDCVIFTGIVNREAMPQLLTDADVLLLCRPNNRQALGGFPTKLGEYLSTGNPVLITRVGDVDRYIIDGYNGFLSEPGNIEQFAKKMNEIVDNYERARDVGKMGRELVYGDFNYKVQTEKVVNIIKQLYFNVGYKRM